MPYFPAGLDSKAAPYFCPNCEKWYADLPGAKTSCCVLHGPGSCCHWGEREVPPPDDQDPGGSGEAHDAAEPHDCGGV